MYLNETYSRAWVVKCLCDIVAIKNGLKQKHALSPWLFNFVLEHAIRRVQANQDGLKLYDTNPFLFMLMMLIYWVEGTESTEAIAVAGKEDGLEVSADKTKCMVVSPDQNVGGSQSIKIYNNSFERVKEFKLATTLMNQNSILEEIKNRLKSRNAWYHLMQNLFLCQFAIQKYKD
jgi:hypothetical protein